jgi:hypothetical protein
MGLMIGDLYSIMSIYIQHILTTGIALSSLGIVAPIMFHLIRVYYNLGHIQVLPPGLTLGKLILY